MANTVWEGRTGEWAFNGPAGTLGRMRPSAAKVSENTNRLHGNTDDKESHTDDTSAQFERLPGKPPHTATSPEKSFIFLFFS